MFGVDPTVVRRYIPTGKPFYLQEIRKLLFRETCNSSKIRPMDFEKKMTGQLRKAFWKIQINVIWVPIIFLQYKDIIV